MNLGFRRRDEKYILDGSKTHAIMGYVNTRKVGQRCDCYIKTRMKAPHLIGRWPCIRIDLIEIRSDRRVYIVGNLLTVDERDRLAWTEGYRTDGPKSPFEQVMDDFRYSLPFTGQVIHWDFTQPVDKNWKGKEKTFKVLVKAAAGGRR